MIANNKSFLGFLVGFLALGLVPTLSAQTTADLAGDWRGRDFSAPVDYRETYFSNSLPLIHAWASASYNPTGYTLADIWLRDSYRVQPKAFTVVGNGGVTGSVNGRMTALGNGLIEVVEPGAVSFGHVCTSNDVMVFLSRDPNGAQDLFLGVRAPDTLQASDLAGFWRTTVFRTPSRLAKIFYNSKTMTARTGFDNARALTDESMTDVYLEEPWALPKLAFTFAANGAISGSATGTVEPQADRSVILNVDGDAIFAALNRSKDVMVFSSLNSGSQELGLMLKAPGALAVADLAGTWRLTTYRSPSKLFKTYWNGTTTRTVSTYNGLANAGERLADVYFRDVVEADRGFLVIGAGGAVTGFFTGTMSVGISGYVGFAENGISAPLDGYINASKTLMVFSETPSDTQSLILLMKVSDATPALNTLLQTPLRLQPAENGQLKVLWVADGSLEVQQATSLTGGGNWSVVPESRGAGQATIQTSGPSAVFLRVVQPAN